MVVKRAGHSGLQCLRLFVTGAALVAAAGCASPLAKSASESELPLADSQAPKVYSKTIPSRPSATVQPRPAPSEADQRMQREIERLTKLNEQLSKTVAQTTAVAAQKAEQQRQASQEAIGRGLRSEFVELSVAAEQTKSAGPVAPAKFSFSDDSDAPAEQTPAPVIEKKSSSDEVKIEAPKAADKPADKPATTAAAEQQPTYQAGDWLKLRDQVIAQLQEEIALARLDKARAAEVGQLETLLRMHYVLAGRRDDAVKPVKELREQEQEFWRSEALGLADLLGSDRLANESRRYAVALKSLEEAESHLAAAGSLTLRNIALCRKVQDFGVVERFKSLDFKPNQEVLLYVEVRNFAAQQKDDQLYETELQGSFRVLDRSGASRAERTLPLDKQTCANLRRDYYIAYRLYIPSELAPGSYTLELTIEDKKGSKSNNALLDFNVVQ